jgi:hypothetical protein
MREREFTKHVRMEALRKFAKEMDVEPRKLKKAELVQYYPYAKDKQERLAVTFFIPTGEEFPRYEELGFDEPLQWFIDEIWKPQIEMRIASLSRRYRSQKIQFAFYRKLAENLGMNLDEFWGNQLREAFIREFSRQEEAPAPLPISSEDDFYAAVGFVFPEDAGLYLQDPIDRIAKATIDLLANKLEEKREKSKVRASSGRNNVVG